MTVIRSLPTVVLKSGREHSVRRRHPWIFSGAVAEVRGQPGAGDFVEVRTKEGGVLGFGHWGTRGIAVRLLSHEPGGEEESVLAERLAGAVRLRERLGLVGSAETTGYRLVHGEGDQLPGLVVDLYASTAVVQCHSAGMWRVRRRVAELLSGAAGPDIRDVVFRKVESQVEGSEAEEQEGTETASQDGHGNEVTFLEGGLRFLADPERGQKTGFFLDQRLNRERIRQLANGRRVLNAFCYTGAFSVYALSGGAASVLSVDASKSALDLCERTVARNFVDGRHTMLAADCFAYLPQMADTFDLVILDPPAFVKHQRALQRGLKGYETINTHVLRRMPRGGLLATFSCSQLVSREIFRETVQRAASIARRSVRVLESLGQAPCHPVSLFHPEGDYLKGLILYVD